MKIDKCLAMQDRAKKAIPGLSQLFSKRPDRFSTGVWPTYYDKAKGATVWDLDGNEYLDMSIGGIGATVLGYADDFVDNAVIEAIRNGVASSLNCPEEILLAEKLCELHPWADMARFARGGGEALAVAIRIARAHTGKDIVAFCGYHGWQDWYLAANVNGADGLNGHLMAGLPPAGVPSQLAGTTFPFMYNKLHELERIAEKHGNNLAAIVMEPIRNFKPEPGFIEGVRKIATECGAALIMDEVSAGFRYNTGGAHMVKHTVTPDMAVFSKALGNGYAISAVIGIAEFMNSAQSTFISSTNWTERVGFVAALATIEKHQRENVADHLVRLGTRVMTQWEALGEKHGLTVKAEGMEPLSHFSIECTDTLGARAYFTQLMLDRGILAANSFYVMYSHTDEDVDRYLAACDECFGLIARAIEKDNLRDKLRGAPAVAGFARIS